MLKTRQVIDSVKSLNHILGLSLPAKISFELAVLVNDLQTTIKSYNSVYSENVKKYGTIILDAEGKETEEYEFTKENRAKFDKEIDSILDIEVDVKIPEIKKSDFNGQNIVPIFLVELGWLIKD